MPKPPFAAHTPPDDDPERWHPLDKHLADTAKDAARFGEVFGAAEACHALGLAHDLGKANPKFQEYLNACYLGKPARSAPHAAPGAKAAYAQLNALALAVLGHHAGLSDVSDVKRQFQEADESAVSAANAFLDSLADFPKSTLVPSLWAREPLNAELFIRMCFSALVDADFLDTERHFSPNKGGQRADYPEVGWYRQRLQEAMKRMAEAAPEKPSKVNDARQEILVRCREKATEKPGAYRLTVPTGGGKTLAGLTFALEHAAPYKLDRVIVAIPYTSIIDQTAQVYGGIFGEENVLEHHSAFQAEDDGEGQSPKELRRRMAAENWDCPLVVTTTVQLFESLLANRTSRCRKLHNIARSVIILDEVQTLPVNLLLPILDVLKQLVEHYGCTVLFCTATQPDFSGLGSNVLTQAEEIVTEAEKYFQSLKRVEYEHRKEPISEDDLAKLIDSKEQVLCVLNSRPDAVRVLKACKEKEGLFHLSTLMCPDHRKKVLAKVRQRLKDKQPVRLVSTQVVEAGVDLDFPLVLRDIGPLDRIIQVAGRCNREALLPDLGRCIIFQLQEAKAPKGPYRTGIELTRTIVNEQAGRLDQPDVVSQYFRDLYTYAGANQGKGKKIQEMRQRLHYKEVAAEFKIIDEDTVSVVVVRYATDIINGILAGGNQQTARALYRKLAPFSVAVSRNHFKTFEREGLVREHESGVWLFEGSYNKVFGIGTGMERDPADMTTQDKEAR